MGKWIAINATYTNEESPPESVFYSVFDKQNNFYFFKI